MNNQIESHFIPDIPARFCVVPQGIDPNLQPEAVTYLHPDMEADCRRGSPAEDMHQLSCPVLHAFYESGYHCEVEGGAPRIGAAGGWELGGGPAYLSTCSMNVDPALPSGYGEKIVALHFLTVEHVGTNVPRESAMRLLPTWEIQHAPGDSTFVYVLGTPAVDAAEIDSLRLAAYGEELASSIVMVWVPVGPEGRWHPSGAEGALAQWRPTVRYGAQELIEHLRDIGAAKAVCVVSKRADPGDEEALHHDYSSLGSAPEEGRAA